MKKTALFLACLTGLIAVYGLSAAEPLPPNSEKLALVEAGTCSEAFASWWGFDENDATESLQKALRSGVKRLVIDKMPSDWVVRPISIPSNIEVALADGVTVRAKPGAFLGVSDALFSIALQENVTIRGGKDSVLAMRKGDYQKEPYKPAEWRHTLSVKSSKNVRIENLTLRESGGDGIYLGVAKASVPCENVVIKNVFCDAHHRQGISVISARNLLIEDCRLSNTAGTPPAAGIDFEPNHANECLVNCVMRRCVLENNVGGAIDLYLPNLNAQSEPLSLTIEDCVTRNNRRDALFLCIGNGADARLTGTMTVRNCRFENDDAAIRIEGKGIDGHALTFENVVVDASNAESIPESLKNRALVSLVNRSTDETPVGKIAFDGLTWIDPLGREAVSYVDQTAFGYGPREISGVIKTQKSADDPGKTLQLGDDWCQKTFPPLNRRALPTVACAPEKIVPAPATEKSEGAPSLLRVRRKGDWLFYATKGEPLTFTLKQYRIGRGELRPVKPTLIAPDGSTRTLDELADAAVDYRIDIDQTGIWRLRLELVGHAFTVVKCSVPNAASEPAIQLIQTTGTFYFYVPEQVKTFAVRVTADDGERVTASIADPSGNRLWREENIDRSVIFDAPDDCASGVWSIQFEKPTVGVLEDFALRFYSLPPLLSTERDKTLQQKD